MPRPAKGPRLYLRTGRVDGRSGKPLPDVYFIRDGSLQVGTGCGPDRLPEAERALSAYIAEKWAPPAAASTLSRRDPAQVLVADVLALYAQERAPKLSDPVSVSGWIRNLLAWWQDRTLSDVRRSTCNAYVAHRTAQFTAGAAARRKPVSDQTARRELEVLSAAIGYWHGEDTLTTRPVVTLPEKPESPRDALTRAQAARLLWAALGHRRDAEGAWTAISGSGRAQRRHLARFLLIGFYTGTRSKVITRLLWSESPAQAWVDLDAGVIYRRGKAEKDKATKRRPVVKIPPRLLAHMRRWKKADEKKGMTPVLHHGGQPIGLKINKGFDACVADAGLPAEITPHWLRHTAATWMMERGVDYYEAAGFLGMTVATLEAHYAHHRPDYQAGAAAGAGGRR